MKLLLVAAFALLGVVLQAEAEKGTFLDEVTFIHYLDENTALEEVRNGNLDIYYWSIPSERIESPESRAGIQIFKSVGGSNSLLVNPAEAETFNPFSLQEVRFALNYLVDRKLIVNEIMGGFGKDIVSNYGPHEPEYLHIISVLESYNFRYDPALANRVISEAMTGAGAVMQDGLWHYDGNPVEITIFIRSDDPIRTSIGELLASELEDAGFSVARDFGDLNKAFVTVYGSDPADLSWHIYTEGWGGRASLVKYDAVGLGQMYSPWFSTMPGFNNPGYWNYENDYIDEITQRIYGSNFTTSEERAELIRSATAEGIDEAVRIFLASDEALYAAGDGVDGIINDFGAGVPSRFTPINARTDSGSLVIGVKQIYQGAWNPVAGLSDVYSTQIWRTLNDPVVFRHPYNGEIFPVRGTWTVETAGPDSALDVPADAVLWDTAGQAWEPVAPGATATSAVTFDLDFSNWHHGPAMDMNDVLYSLYFSLEWGSSQQDAGADSTFDPEFSPRAAQSAATIKGIRILDQDTVQMYVDYWHFDETEIVSWASAWSTTPWETYAAMEQAVLDGKVAFSRSDATGKGVNWLSLLVQNDAHLVQEYLDDFEREGHVPAALAGRADAEYAAARYDAASRWIGEMDHAVISNGPFYLEQYSPESRFIKVRAFDDPSYPFAAGHWSSFEDVRIPQIVSVGLPGDVAIGAAFEIPIELEDATDMHYFVTDSAGSSVVEGMGEVDNGMFVISVGEDASSALSPGTHNLKLFAISDSVLKPDVYSSSFLALPPSEAAGPETEEAAAPETPAVTPPDDPSGGCLIATAAYGSELAPQVQFLREMRDGRVLQTAAGASFMAGFGEFYYSFSPAVADLERESPVFRDAVRVAITPGVYALSIMALADPASEASVLAVGIAAILALAGIYIVAPSLAVYAAARAVRR